MAEGAQQPHDNIHADYGRLSLVESVHLICMIVWILVSSIPAPSAAVLASPLTKLIYYLLEELSHKNVSPSAKPEPPSILLKSSFSSLTPHHRTNKLFTYRQVRLLIRPQASTILSSRRYSTVSQNLYHRIARPRFAGYWIIQSSLTNSKPPQHSDVTIFFLHGGGYFASQPDTYLLFLLRLAEAILAQEITVSIFALDYHLAPEHPYPAQLEEAKAAYEYLLHEMAIPVERLVIMGDSAGGHLALSTLVSLHQGASLPKPGGAMFFSPWLSLHHTPSTNARNDVLSALFLRATARHFLGSARADSDSEETRVDPLLEFLDPHPEMDWGAVLPKWIWLSAGTNEIMFDDLVVWTHALEKKLGRKRVDWEWGEEEVHDWQWMETMDEGAKRRFLQKEGECEDFEAVVRIGRIFGSRMVRGRG